MLNMRYWKKNAAATVAINVLLFCLVLPMTAAAQTPYLTYTYSNAGEALISPAAYTPSVKQADFGEAGALKNPADILADKEGQIYIADSGNNRILILDSSLKLLKTLQTFVNDKGEEDSLNGAQGMYLTDDGDLYVADTENGRILVFDSQLKYKRTVGQISSSLLPENFSYKPKAVAVNKGGRMYIVSRNTNMGVIVLSGSGEFEGFIGAERVSVNPLQMFWRTFMSKEQLARSTNFVPVEYNNITIDSDGFLYVTSSSINRYDLFSSKRSHDSAYAPVKKINPAGTDVLRRNGFFAPIGDVSFSAYANKKKSSPSAIGDVCLLDNQSYLLVDTYYSKMFAYDYNGDLLYAFGGKGEAEGLYGQLSSVIEVNDSLYALDSLNGTVTILKKTDYARKIDHVIQLQFSHQNSEAVENWREILQINNNFDLAYLGIGKSLLDDGQYQNAMNYFKLIDNQTYYSKAYSLMRQNFLVKYGIWILIGSVILIVLIMELFTVAKKANRVYREVPSTGKIKDELVYGMFVIFHPFKGFYELKQEKRGSLKSASILFLLAMAAFVYSKLGKAYLLCDPDESTSLITGMINFLVPAALWCIANWCLTSMMDGKGTMKDIFITVSYSLVPFILILIPVTILGHFLVMDEFNILNMAVGACYFWVGLLIFFGMLTIHDYSLGEDILVSLLTIVGIGIMLFLIMIFFSMWGQITLLIKNMIQEVSFRS